MRRKLIVGNWKMNGDREGLAEIAVIAHAAEDADMIDVGLALPATLIAVAVDHFPAVEFPAIAFGGQDVHAADAGAHTGCISAPMLNDAGARFTIVGHSERRADQGETDADVRAKAAAARRHGLSAILCVGETEAERDAGRAGDVIRAQIAASLPDAAAGDWLAIAYEPRWAIGTGRTPTRADIAEIHQIARKELGDRLGSPAAAGIRILYGGSVTGENAGEILSIEDVDGVLVGGASLTAAKFLPIIAAAVAASGRAAGKTF